MPERKPIRPLAAGLEAGYRWTCAAHDATPDDGVSTWYDLLGGWFASYPETTGYIIPTLLSYSKVMSQPEAAARALRMADWEIEVQLPTGAVRSGGMSAKVAPAVFNTGQVLFGWVAAFEATRDVRYWEAARRAAQWLLQVQDDDGAWRKDLSQMTSSAVQTYNIRSAWGLALAGQLFDERTWIHAARRNAEWALAQQRTNGWFDNNAFSSDEAPLLHTIGYAIEGCLGMGALLNCEAYVHAAHVGVEPLVALYERGGVLSGRYGSDWSSAASWRCLTGEAQIALVLLRLAKYQAPHDRFKSVGTRIIEGLARLQDTDTSCPGIHGGLAGSEPVWGGYCSFRYLNWAVKFYMDALLMALHGEDVSGLSNIPTQAQTFLRT
jgi:hypothetical protein